MDPHGKLLLNPLGWIIEHLGNTSEIILMQLIFWKVKPKDALDQSHSKLIAAAPAAAQRLIDVINDENNRGYVVVQAVESLFRIIDRGITDRENAEHIKEIKESLNALEGGRVVDA
jgi:hypothetical protein